MSSVGESMDTMDIDDNDGGSSTRVPGNNMDLPIDPRLFQTADEPVIFAEDEETESFYITIDLTAANVVVSSTNQKGLDNKGIVEPTNEDTEENAHNDAEKSAVRSSQAVRNGKKDNENNSLDFDSSKIQILDFSSDNPLIKFEGRIYQCQWNDCIGTDLFFLPPKSNTDVSEEEELNKSVPQATYLGQSRLRLEGLRTTVELNDMIETKQEKSLMAADFMARYEAALRNRLARENKTVEDVLGIVGEGIGDSVRVQENDLGTSAMVLESSSPE